MSFNFGQQPGVGAAAAPSTFGTKPPTLGLATPSSTPSAFAPTFGAPLSGASVGVVAPQAQMPLFGAAGTKPDALATSTPSFGAPPTATPAFGAPVSSSLSFGAPVAGTPSFGAPLAGTPSFGAPVAGTPSFGAPVAGTPSFGAPVAGTPSFGAPSTVAPSFGASQTPSGLFGAGTSAPSSSSGLFSGLNAPKPTPSFGTSTAAPTLNFGAGSSFSSLAPASSAGQGFTLGGVAALAAPAVPAAPTAIASVGLGGVDTTTSAAGLSSLSGLAGTQAARTEAKSPKEFQIPDDIARGVETFRQYVKKQKSFSSEIARSSSKPLLKVQEDTDAMKQVLSNNTASLQRLKSIADKLKSDTAKALQHTEMAQRTHDTPPGLQYDNTAPLQYFSELVAGFERDIKLFRQEIDNAERHVNSHVQLNGITPAELTQAMRRLYDSFVALAGRLHTVHSQVQAQKEQYLSLRKYILNDTSDVFDGAARNKVNFESYQGGKASMVGPTPFSALNAQQGFGLLSAGAAASSRQNFPGVGSLGWSGPGGPANTTGGTPLPLTPHPDNPQFQLQKPPSGNKRGKR